MKECTDASLHDEVKNILQDRLGKLRSGEREPLRKIGNMTVSGNMDKAMEMLELVGINNVEKRMKQYPHEFSGGMRQRVMIAMGLICHPKLLIADEPTGNLDGKAGREVLTLLRTVSHELGITLVLVTHDMKVAEQADRIIRLADGQIESDSGAGL